MAMRRPSAFTSEDFLKIAVILAIALIDVAWTILAPIKVVWLSTLHVVAVVAFLLAVAEFYGRWRPNRDFVVMVRETAWLLAFSAVAAILSNLVITLNLPLVDDSIAAMDRALHLDWPAYYAYVTARPVLGMVYALLYFTALPFIAFAIITLPLVGRVGRASELVLAAMIGALIAIVVSALWPTAGALAYFRPDESLALHHTIVDLGYKQAFFDLRSGALTTLSLDDIRGLIAVPSYHATLNVIIVLAFRGIWKFFWPMLALNLAMMATAPVEGGHHFTGVIAGAVVAVVAVGLADRLHRWLGAIDGGAALAAVAEAGAAAPNAPGQVSDQTPAGAAT